LAILEERIEKYKLRVEAAQSKNEEWGHGILTISDIIQINKDKLDDAGNPVITTDIENYLAGLRFHYFIHSQGLERVEEVLQELTALFQLFEGRICVVEQAQELVEELGDDEATISLAQEARLKEVIETFIDVEERIRAQKDAMA
jgi:hypothetical protein